MTSTLMAPAAAILLHGKSDARVYDYSLSGTTLVLTVDTGNGTKMFIYAKQKK